MKLVLTLLVASLTLTGCASSSSEATSLVGTWHHSGSKTTEYDFDYFNHLLALKADGSFFSTHKQVTGRRHRFHPRPPEELVSVSEGIWQIRDGIYTQKVLSFGGLQLPKGQQRETQYFVKRTSETEFELMPIANPAISSRIFYKSMAVVP